MWKFTSAGCGLHSVAVAVALVVPFVVAVAAAAFSAVALLLALAFAVARGDATFVGDRMRRGCGDVGSVWRSTVRGFFAVENSREKNPVSVPSSAPRSLDGVDMVRY